MAQISVIMTCYNEKLEWVRESIESILNQTYKNLEFIIVLDDPENIELKEELLNYSKDDSRIKLIFNDENLGLVKSLNKALKISSGKYIARMDADDISYLDRFELQYKYLNDNKDIYLVGGIGAIINENGDELFKINPLGGTSEKAEKSLFYRNIFFHPSWMFRREVLNDLKGYDDLPRTEDIDFLCRLILNNYKIVNLPNNVLKVRIRKNGITNSNNLQQIKVARIIMKNYKKALNNKGKYDVENEIANIKISDKEIKKYGEACLLYTSALSQLRNKKYYSGVVSLAKSFLSSSEKRKDFYSTIFIKIINR